MNTEYFKTLSKAATEGKDLSEVEKYVLTAYEDYITYQLPMLVLRNLNEVAYNVDALVVVLREAEIKAVGITDNAIPILFLYKLQEKGITIKEMQLINYPVPCTMPCNKVTSISTPCIILSIS